MLVHLRRSVILSVDLPLSSAFAYAFAGVGVSQLLFKHQADGSITANGSTLIGQNWSDTNCPGHPRAAASSTAGPTTLGPYAADAKATPARPPAVTTRWSQTATAGSRARPTSGPARRCWWPTPRR